MTSAIEVYRQLERYDVLLVAKESDWLMRMAGFFLGRRFMTDFWTTYRLPFGRPRICFPTAAAHPGARLDVLSHELVHVQQFAPWWGPLGMAIFATLLPLPALFSGRWYIERGAYLQDVLAGNLTIDDAVGILWHGYGWPWPRPLMLAWFRRQVIRASA